MVSETAHLPLLFAVEHQLELEGLPTFHAFSIIWSMDKIKDLRHGRHCTSAMHVHLVFVTKRRHCSFDGQAIEALRAIFSTSSSATLNSRPHRYSRGLPRPEVRGLRHSRGQHAEKMPATFVEFRLILYSVLTI